MIHHVSVGTNDADRARRFYAAVMPTVGAHPVPPDDGLTFGFGAFAFSIEVPDDGRPASVGNGAHVAFAVETRAAVRRFHAAALANGGTDAGAPGLRPKYDAHYYGAFVRDPDGNKLEAVTYAAA